MCLPGRDWTECNRERWHLLAPRRKERLPLLSLDGDADSSPESVYLYREINPTQYLFGDVSWNSWNRLAKPSPPDHTSRSPHKVSSPLGSHALFRNTSLAPLECMPAELLALILADDALERQDILALGLSSTALWPHAVQCVREACFDAAAPWAGTPIACLGNYLLDLPPVLANECPEPAGHEIITIHHSDGQPPWRYRDEECWARKVVRNAEGTETGFKTLGACGGFEPDA